MDEFKCNVTPCKCANFENKIFGDIILSLNSARRLIPNNLSKQDNLQGGYIRRRDDQLWKNHKVNGKYIVPYKINHGLDSFTKSLIPKVCTL